MKNVLVIVYYFPPMGGSGVQRPLKFVKYLKEFGWNPIVLCPEPGAYHTFDDSLQKELDDMHVELHRIPVSTPFHKMSGGKPVKKVQTSDRLSKLLRRLSRLFFYPDNKRGWINPAIKKGEELIREKNIESIFSTAPPFSNHLAAAELKKRTGLPLVLDYRDSWVDNHFFTGLFGWQKRIMRKMEKKCLAQADVVTGLDPFMLQLIDERYPRLNLIGRVLPHGYDPEDFEGSTDSTLDYINGKLNILYGGLFYESNQPDIFLKSLAELIKEDPAKTEQIELHFQGGLEERHLDLIRRLGLDEITHDYGYLSHKEAVANIRKADLLWMLSNFDQNLRQVKSGKLFEYIGSRKPILGLVHPGEESRILSEYKAGFSAVPNDPDKVKVVLRQIIEKWEDGSLEKADPEFVKRFDRKALTEELASIFNVISQ